MHTAHNREVLGSIPRVPTIICFCSLTVRILDCHSGDRGSTPRGSATFQFIDCLLQAINFIGELYQSFQMRITQNLCQSESEISEIAYVTEGRQSA